MELDYYEKFDVHYPNDSIFCLKKFTKNELIKLSLEIDKIIEKSTDVNLSNLEYVINISGKTLILKYGERSKGIEKINENIYECILTKEEYIEMKEMLLHYEIEKSVTYYWLYDVGAEIEFLLSESGKW